MKQTFIFILMFLSLSSLAADLRGRMGVGATNQLANGVPAISLKIQRSKTYALGAVVGFKSDEENTLYGAGVKFYRIIFDEPQLNFYLSGLFAAQNYIDTANQVQSGHQVDANLGTEFHFAGLESIGFSFEFGISARNEDSRGSSLETVGDQIIKSAVHFYL